MSICHRLATLTANYRGLIAVRLITLLHDASLPFLIFAKLVSRACTSSASSGLPHAYKSGFQCRQRLCETQQECLTRCTCHCGSVDLPSHPTIHAKRTHHIAILQRILHNMAKMYLGSFARVQALYLLSKLRPTFALYESADAWSSVLCATDLKRPYVQTSPCCSRYRSASTAGVHLSPLQHR